MQKGFLPSVLFASLISLVALQGCKKESALGIDNDKVVKTPYSFYAANSEGWLINTNDGEHFSSIFPPDGYAPTSILTAGENLLFLKQNLHMSQNDGKNFNPVYTNVRKFPWQNAAYYALGQDRVYITSNSGKGIAMSTDKGKSFQDDINWEADIPPVFTISSFAGLSNNAVFAYSNINNVLFRKGSGDGNWEPVTAEGLFPVDGPAYYLSSNNSTLFLTDYEGLGGVWYTEDEGVHWFRFGQGSLPFNHRWLCAASPAGGQSFLVGTDSSGVYRVENGKFVPANVGLEKNMSVYGMAVKKNIYKNDATRTYVFIGTNKGIYRSEDLGITWDKMTSGSFDGKYTAAY